jgi:hypothetical protein
MVNLALEAGGNHHGGPENHSRFLILRQKPRGNHHHQERGSTGHIRKSVYKIRINLLGKRFLLCYDFATCFVGGT